MNIRSIEDTHDTVYNGAGSDSRVFLYSGRIIKVYRPLQCVIGIDRAFSIVKQYEKDTREVSKKFSKKSEYFIDLNKCRYRIIPAIIPQGDTQISIDEIVYNSDQKYIDGQSIAQMLRSGSGRNYANSQSTSQNLFSEEVFWIHRSILPRISSEVSNSIGRKFSVVPTNVKPLINHKKKIVYLQITDLADSLTDRYFEYCRNISSN